MLSQEGVHPNVIVCRTEHPISLEIKRKIALFCNVKPEAVIEAQDASTIYEVPLKMLEQNLDRYILKKLNLDPRKEPDLNRWLDFLQKLREPNKTITIGLIGKYVELQDAYKSILEAFIHAGAVHQCKVNIENIHSESLNASTVASSLSHLNGLLVAPGFGSRGVEGKIEAVRYAREHNLPFLGICLGMQMAVIEFARHVIGWSDAHSTEMNDHTTHPVIDLMEEQKSVQSKGGTMRLGAYACTLQPDSLAAALYGSTSISERHRHRWEFNNTFAETFQTAGMALTGQNPDNGLIEVVEIKNHPFFIGVQFHPELKSTVEVPHPLFVGLVQAAISHQQQS
jgi:CTP synthase